MGLDSVEIILAVEEEFGLTIPDADAARMITVGDRLAFVVKDWALTKPPLSSPSYATAVSPRA